MELKSKLMFPNPFKPVGVEFELSEDAMVSLTIIDETGKIVEKIINDKQFGPGHHKCLIELPRESNRKYLYRLEVKSRDGEYVETKRIG